MVTGKVLCWGANSHGQLGSGTQTQTSYAAIEVVELGAGVTAIAAGSLHTCAQKSDGSAWCWGSNQFGQLGNGQIEEAQPFPTKVVALPPNVFRVDGGGKHSCAVLTDGAIWCWGANDLGQLGIGTTAGSVALPQLVGTLSNGVVDLALGFHHTCALHSDKTVWCWGGNDANQLGSEGGNKSLPEQVGGLGQAIETLSAGYRHTCAVDNAGSAHCWGYNWFGQLGIGKKSLPVAEPQTVVGTGPVLQIAAGETHSCARMADNQMICWGDNYFGELGNGQTTEELQLTPVAAHLSCQ